MVAVPAASAAIASARRRRSVRGSLRHTVDASWSSRRSNTPHPARAPAQNADIPSGAARARAAVEVDWRARRTATGSKSMTGPVHKVIDRLAGTFSVEAPCGPTLGVPASTPYRRQPAAVTDRGGHPIVPRGKYRRQLGKRSNNASPSCICDDARPRLTPSSAPTSAATASQSSTHQCRVVGRPGAAAPPPRRRNRRAIAPARRTAHHASHPAGRRHQAG